MLSFSLKTRRYQSLVKYTLCPLSIPYINLILEISRSTKLLNLSTFISGYMIYFNKVFLKTFWKYYKTFISRNVGLMSNNLHKSFMFRSLYMLNAKLWNTKSCLNSTNYKHISYSLYLKPISMFSFAFQNRVYDTLLFLVFTLINTNYYSFKNDFRLLHSFILYQDNYRLFYFCNIDYFKIHSF